MKLYVWEGVLADYTGGIAFALAPNLREARRLVSKEINPALAKDGWIDPEILVNKPQVFTGRVGFAMRGGG